HDLASVHYLHETEAIQARRLKASPRSSRCFGHQSAIRPMRRWRGNGRFYPEGVKRSLGLAEAESPKGLSAEGASPAPTSKHPKRRVARPKGRASTCEEKDQVQ